MNTLVYVIAVFFTGENFGILLDRIEFKTIDECYVMARGIEKVSVEANKPAQAWCLVKKKAHEL